MKKQIWTRNKCNYKLTSKKVVRTAEIIRTYTVRFSPTPHCVGWSERSSEFIFLGMIEVIRTGKGNSNG